MTGQYHKWGKNTGKLQVLSIGDIRPQNEYLYTWDVNPIKIKF